MKHEVVTVARSKKIHLFSKLSRTFINPAPPFYLFVNRWYASGEYSYYLSWREDMGGLDGRKISRTLAKMMLDISREI